MPQGFMGPVVNGEIYKVGPGPSSSHTIAPKRISLYFKAKYPEATRYKVACFGSLSMVETGNGHGTFDIIRDVLGENCEFDNRYPGYKPDVPIEKIPTNFRGQNPNKVGSLRLPHENTMDLYAYGARGELLGSCRAKSIGGGSFEIIGDEATIPRPLYPQKSFMQIREFCAKHNYTPYEYLCHYEGKEQVDAFLGDILDRMMRSVDEGLEAPTTRFKGSPARRLAKCRRFMILQLRPTDLDLSNTSQLLGSYAVAVSDQNADRREIVTAPTCGACGVIPAILYLAKRRNVDMFPEEQRAMRFEKWRQLSIEALAAAAVAINVVKRNATLSGAEAGCQAEIGVSMAAGAMAQVIIRDSNNPKVNKEELWQLLDNAGSLALCDTSGLSCLPVNGRVETPCILRNEWGADIAYRIASYRVYNPKTLYKTFDMEVAGIMDVGASLPVKCRESGLGPYNKAMRKHFGRIYAKKSGIGPTQKAMYESSKCHGCKKDNCLINREGETAARRIAESDQRMAEYALSHMHI